MLDICLDSIRLGCKFYEAITSLLQSLFGHIFEAHYVLNIIMSGVLHQSPSFFFDIDMMCAQKRDMNEFGEHLRL